MGFIKTFTYSIFVNSLDPAADAIWTHKFVPPPGKRFKILTIIPVARAEDLILGRWFIQDDVGFGYNSTVTAPNLLISNTLRNLSGVRFGLVPSDITLSAGVGNGINEGISLLNNQRNVFGNISTEYGFDIFGNASNYGPNACYFHVSYVVEVDEVYF